MSHENVPFPQPPVDKPVANMSKDELLLYFNWLGFTDASGHRLTLCQDFLELLERACGQ